MPFWKNDNNLYLYRKSRYWRKVGARFPMSILSKIILKMWDQPSLKRLLTLLRMTAVVCHIDSGFMDNCPNSLKVNEAHRNGLPVLISPQLIAKGKLVETTHQVPRIVDGWDRRAASA